MHVVSLALLQNVVIELYVYVLSIESKTRPRHEVESCISTIAPNTLFDFWPTTSHADATSNTDRSSSLQHFHVHLAIFQIRFEYSDLIFTFSPI